MPLKEPDKRAQSKSYLWLQRGGSSEQQIILYDYDPGRGVGLPLLAQLPRVETVEAIEALLPLRHVQKYN